MPSAKDQPLLTRIAELAGADVAAAVQREFGGFVKYIPAGQMAQYNAALVDALMAESRRSDGKTGLTRARAAQLLDICGLGQEQTAHGQYQATHPAGQAAGTASCPTRLSPPNLPPQPARDGPAAAHSAAQTQPAGSEPGSPLDDHAAAAAAPIPEQGEGQMPSGQPGQSPDAARQSPAGGPEYRHESVLSGGGGLWTDETYQLLALMNKMQAIVLNRLIADEAHANDLFGGAL